MPGWIGREALEIEAQGCAFRAGAGQPVDDAGAVALDADALMLGYRAVDRVGIGEIVCLKHGELATAPAGQGRELRAQSLDQPVGVLGVEPLIIMASVV